MAPCSESQHWVSLITDEKVRDREENAVAHRAKAST
jgi:hypothetical protein